MIVILAHADDAAALWLARGLNDLGVQSVELVAVEQLVFSRRIVHRLSSASETSSVRLADGRVLRSETITGIVNRVRYLPTQHFAAVDQTDRAYATAELHAFVLAWLNGVAGRVINPPLPFSLGGVTFRTSTVVHLAALAGLPTASWRGSTVAEPVQLEASLPPTHSVVVLDGRIYGALLPRPLQAGCGQLAALLGLPLLEVQLHHSRGYGWRFLNATGGADFRLGGTPLASALARALVVERAA